MIVICGHLIAKALVMEMKRARGEQHLILLEGAKRMKMQTSHRA